MDTIDMLAVLPVPIDGVSSKSPSASSTVGQRRARSIQSCDLCRARKVRCDREENCAGCVARGIPCERKDAEAARQHPYCRSKLSAKDNVRQRKSRASSIDDGSTSQGSSPRDYSRSLDVTSPTLPHYSAFPGPPAYSLVDTTPFASSTHLFTSPSTIAPHTTSPSWSPSAQQSGAMLTQPRTTLYTGGVPTVLPQIALPTPQTDTTADGLLEPLLASMLHGTQNQIPTYPPSLPPPLPDHAHWHLSAAMAPSYVDDNVASTLPHFETPQTDNDTPAWTPDTDSLDSHIMWM